MEPQWEEFDDITSDFQFRDVFEQIKNQSYLAYISSLTKNCSDNSLATRNIAYDKPKEVEPFIIVYKSRPIRGIVLELWGKNPEYNWEV